MPGIWPRIFLNRDEFRLGSVRFFGATLWTDFMLFGDDTRATAMREADAVMSDYRRIRLAKGGLPQATAGRHCANPLDGPALAARKISRTI